MARDTEDRDVGDYAAWQTHPRAPHTSPPTQRVTRALDELIEVRGAPRRQRLDNCPEFISAALKQWAKARSIELSISNRANRSKMPTSNASTRPTVTEVLGCYVFTSLNEVRRMTEDWRNVTTTNDPIAHWADSHPSCTRWHNHPSLLLSDSEKRGRFKIGHTFATRRAGHFERVQRTAHRTSGSRQQEDGRKMGSRVSLPESRRLLGQQRVGCDG